MTLPASGSFDHLFKVLVIGDHGVGSSSLVKRYGDQVFQDSEKINASGDDDFRIRTIQVNSKTIKLQVWDVDSLDNRTRPVFAMFRRARGVMVLFDTTSLESFQNATTKWMARIDKLASEDVLVVLVGTKSDLTSRRAVSVDVAQTWADAHQLPYWETSSKTGANVDDSFRALTTAFLQSDPPLHSSAIQLANWDAGHIQKNGYCY